MRTSTPFLTTTCIAALAICGGEARAGDCKDAGALAKKLVEAASKLCESGQGRFKNCDPKKLGQAVSQADYWVKWWNELAGETWAHLGPRHLSFNAQDKGTVVNPGVRTWVSLGPSAGRAKVDVRALSGKAGMDVSYCAITADGRVDFLGKDSVGAGQSVPAREFSEAEVGGKFVVVKLDGTGGMGKKYEYNILLTGTMVQ